MKNSFIYQLACNSEHNMYFYLKINRNRIFIIIFKLNEKGCKKYETLELKEKPISAGWINSFIYLQTERDICFLNVKDMNLKHASTPPFKIKGVFSFEQDTLVYSTNIDADYIDYYEFDLKDCSVNKKIASYNIYSSEVSYYDLEYRQKYELIIEKNISDINNFARYGLIDSNNGRNLFIYHDDLNTTLRCEEGILNIYGFVDRAFIIGDSIVLSYSSFNKCEAVYKINILDSMKINHRMEYQRDFKTSYHLGKDSGVYYYKLFPDKRIRGVIVMLHGGPASRYYNRYDPIVYDFINSDYVVFLINYYGSTGYGYEYASRLYRQGGSVDLGQVKYLLEEINSIYKGYPIHVIGDSYGGYLAIMVSIQMRNLIKKVYAMNAFTDLRFQFIFSKARHLIEKYFPHIASEDIKKVNPIDLVNKNRVKLSLMIINGKNDDYCPYQQLIQFKEVSGCDLVLLNDYPHYKINHLENNEMLQIIKNDMRQLEL